VVWRKGTVAYNGIGILKIFMQQLVRKIGQYWLYIFMGLTVVSSFLLLWYLNKLEIFPATLFSVIAVFFSYHAYVFSKEKFRLDLFDRRVEIYKEMVDFCSIVCTYASLTANDGNKEDIKKAHQAAAASFRGIGYHKTNALFGEDIYELCKKLNQSYAYLVSFNESPPKLQERAKWAQDRMQHIEFISATLTHMPKLFRSYIYFGDYKA
jgi:hypothetical protein